MMWIRSQNKKILLKTDRLFVECDDLPGEPNSTYSIFNYEDYLGTYKTEKRALEVLDEIQEYINNNCEFIERKTHTSMGTYTNKIKTKVYEMPEE